MPQTYLWRDSSVGRAIDWKSMCPRFKSGSRHHIIIWSLKALVLLKLMPFSVSSNLFKGDKPNFSIFWNGKNQSYRLAWSFPSLSTQFEPRDLKMSFFVSISPFLNLSLAYIAKSNVHSTRSVQFTDSFSNSSRRICRDCISVSISCLFLSYSP